MKKRCPKKGHRYILQSCQQSVDNYVENKVNKVLSIFRDVNKVLSIFLQKFVNRVLTKRAFCGIIANHKSLLF